MGLTYDDFIRTTEGRHYRGMQKLWSVMQERGFIYKGSYTGQYCVSDELYVDAPPARPARIAGASRKRSAKKTTSSSSPPSNASCWSSSKNIRSSSGRNPAVMK